MIFISPAHAEACLSARRDVLLTGGGLPVIQLYDGEQPVPGGPPDGALIASAGIASVVITGGVMLITPVSAPVLVQATGTPTWARILTAAGEWWMDGDASGSPGALVTLDTPGPYYYGGRIAIDSMVIA